MALSASLLSVGVLVLVLLLAETSPLAAPKSWKQAALRSLHLHSPPPGVPAGESRRLGTPAGMDAPPPRYRRTWTPETPKAPKAPVVAAEGKDPYRLPTIIVPTRYRLFLAVDVENFLFQGQVSIHVNALESTDTIVLHAGENLKFQDGDISVQRYKPATGETVVEYTVTKVERDSNYQTVTLTLDNKLVQSRHYIITFAIFESVISDFLSGFYRSSYIENGVRKWLATTQFEPTHAREAFPCFDEPSFKARFEIQIACHKKFVVRANMPGIVSYDSTDQYDMGLDADADDDVTITEFDSTVPMSTYLLAWVVSDFTSLSNEDDTFMTWARKDIVAGGDLSQSTGQKALQELGEYNGVPYALPKTDQFAIPDFSAGAMENWGLVTYREQYLITMASTDVRYEQLIQTVICHELGHQWSGNLVTMDWWSHTWLNEGFATFFENFICDKINPDLKLLDKAITDYADEAMNMDASADVHAMSSEVSDYQQIETKFDTISYAKGGTVLRMFQHILTPAVFQKGLNIYFSTNRFKNSDPTKLFNALALAVEGANSGTVTLPDNTDFAKVATSWTEQSGVPVVTVTRQGGKAVLRQRQFRFTVDSLDPQADKKWYIPITVLSSKTHSATPSPIQWLTPEVESVTIEVPDDEWLIINPKQTGYYRVEYESKDLDKLLFALVNPTGSGGAEIEAASRAQILLDVLALTRAGRYDWVVPIPFLETLSMERETSVWQAAVNIIITLQDYLANTDVYPSFKMLLAEYTKLAFQEVGLAVNPAAPHNTRHLRFIATRYACEFGNEQCLKDASESLQSWLKDPTIIPHPDVLIPTLCYGVKGSPGDVFKSVKSLWQEAEAESTMRLRLIGALACTADTSLLKEFLAEVLASASSTDTMDLFAAVIERTEHHRFVFNYIKDNRVQINSVKKGLVVILLQIWIRSIRSDSELQAIKRWVLATFVDLSGFAALNRSLNAVDKELDSWYRKEYTATAAYIYERTKTSPPTPDPTEPTNTPKPVTNPPKPVTNPPKPVTNPTMQPATTPSNGASPVSASAILLSVAVLLCSTLLH